jgi:hypothetical protein
MKNLRLFWSDEGWILEVETALPQPALDRAIAWAVPHQVQRYNGLPAGDIKEALGRQIDLLRKGHVTQRPVMSAGEVVGFQSTRRTRPDRAFII